MRYRELWEREKAKWNNEDGVYTNMRGNRRCDNSKVLNDNSERESLGVNATQYIARDLETFCTAVYYRSQ